MILGTAKFRVETESSQQVCLECYYEVPNV